MRKWMFAIVLQVLALEACMGGLLLWAWLQRPRYFEDFYRRQIEEVSTEEIQAFRAQGHDPRLGWVPRPGAHRTMLNSAKTTVTERYDQLAARNNPLYKDRSYISAYGESHTLGSEVDDDETWPYFLSQRTRSNVRNFGVGGYGTDQAVLRLEQNLERGLKTPFVILTIQQENINRIVNTYRPFYFAQTGATLGFKPRFVSSETGLRLVPNPLPVLQARIDVFRALDRAEESDYWRKHTRAVVAFRPPFTLRALDLFLTVLDGKGVLAHPFRDLGLMPEDLALATSSAPLWRDPQVGNLMHGILDFYRGLARHSQSRAVVLFLPAIAMGEDGALRQPSYVDFVRELRARHAEDDLLVLDLADAEFDVARFSVRPDGGHPSAYGNRVIADFLFDRLSAELGEFKAGANNPEDSRP